jgi:REP element-mobilizing transposase RayT
MAYRCTSCNAGTTANRASLAKKIIHAYLHWLGEALKKEQCALHAYALMTNHVHLLLTPEHAQAVPRLLIALGRRYVHNALGQVNPCLARHPLYL